MALVDHFLEKKLRIYNQQIYLMTPSNGNTYGPSGEPYIENGVANAQVLLKKK